MSMNDHTHAYKIYDQTTTYFTVKSYFYFLSFLIMINLIIHKSIASLIIHFLKEITFTCLRIYILLYA